MIWGNFFNTANLSKRRIFNCGIETVIPRNCEYLDIVTDYT